MPFADVPPAAWFHDYVTFAYDRELMQGISATLFAPKENLTRAMFATILWRMAGEPVPAEELRLLDVSAGQWYSEAIAWAHSEGIIAEMVDSDGFSPTDDITREEMAYMMFRYAYFAGHDVSVYQTLEWAHFMDRHYVSDWAEDAMRWAVENRIIIGTSVVTLHPHGTATRAQCATILVRYAETFEG